MTREEFDFKVQNSKYKYSSVIDRNKYLSNIKGKYITSLEQHIAELELQLADANSYFDNVHTELEAPKTCEGCKFEYIDNFGVFICKSFQNFNCLRDQRLNDRYEPKEIQ